MAVNKHSLNHSLKQQISSSRRISSCSLILKDYFANSAIEITVSHAVAFEEDKNRIYWIVCVSLTASCSSRLLHRARSQCDLTVVTWSSWHSVTILIPLTWVTPPLTSPCAFWSHWPAPCFGTAGGLLGCSIRIWVSSKVWLRSTFFKLWWQ